MAFSVKTFENLATGSVMKFCVTDNGANLFRFAGEICDYSQEPIVILKANRRPREYFRGNETENCYKVTFKVKNSVGKIFADITVFVSEDLQYIFPAVNYTFSRGSNTQVKIYSMENCDFETEINMETIQNHMRLLGYFVYDVLNFHIFDILLEDSAAVAFSAMKNAAEPDN